MENSIVKSSSEQLQFKTVAKDAVSRMKHGFWEDMQKRKQAEKESGKTQETTDKKLEIQKIIVQKPSESAEDQEFEQKAYALLEEDELSPIGKLMDKQKYEQMTIEERGRYVLIISNKFLKIKEKFEREKTLKSKFSKVMNSLHM